MSPADEALSGRQPKAVISALRVLEEVARTGAGTTAKDIATRLSMPSATTYRLLNLLAGEGYVARLPDLSGFALGRKIGILVDAAITPIVCTAARTTLSELRLSVRFGVHLYYYTETGVRSADLDPEYGPVADDNHLNRHLYASAVGKLLLAEKSHLDPILPRGESQPLTARTLVVRSEQLHELELIREQGYATQVGELRDDSAGLAVPIRSASGTLVAGLVLSGQPEHHPLMLRHLDPLREYADQLTPLLS